MSRHTSPRLYRPCHTIAHPCSGPARVHETEQGGAQLAAEREKGGKHHANAELVEQHAVPPRFSRRVERRLHRGAVYAGCARNCSQDHGAETDSQGAHQRDPRPAHAARDHKTQGVDTEIVEGHHHRERKHALLPCRPRRLHFQSCSRNCPAMRTIEKRFSPPCRWRRAVGGNCCPECWG